MKKESLTFNNLLTWEDIIELGIPMDLNCPYLNYSFLFSCCSGKYAKNQLENNIKNYLYAPFSRKFPDCPFPVEYLDMALCYSVSQNGKWELRISKAHFILSLLQLCAVDKVPENEYDKALKSFITDNDIKNSANLILREEKSIICEKIRDFDMSNFHIINLKEAAEALEIFKEQRKNINWALKNINKIFEFLNCDIDLELLNPISKDLYLLNTGYRVLKHSQICAEDCDSKKEKFKLNIDGLCFLNNYSLMIDYLNNENDDNYDCGYSQYLPNDNCSYSLSSKYLLEKFKELEKYATLSNNYLTHPNRFNTYEELLSTKASKTWKRIKSEKHAKKYQT